MREYFNRRILGILMLLMGLFLFTQSVTAQTPGIIYKPSSTTLGRKILDPNSDGFTSPTTAGFIGTDYGNGSELNMIPLPQLMTEPHGDPQTGGTGGHTDVVSLDGGNSVAVLKTEVDGKSYLVVRFRIGKASTARKGYSLLIDTNNEIDGNKSPNPGFEKEVILETGVGVKIYTHNINAGTSTFILYDLEAHHQRSIALSTNNGDPDYFYDFFVPYEALGISAGSKVRMAATTITSAQSGINGTSSDVNGVNDSLYGRNTSGMYADLIGSFPPTNLDDLTEGGSFGPILSFAPTVNSPISTNSTFISGTSKESNGSTITIYSNGNTIGTATVNDFKWQINGVSGLQERNIITAKATAPGKAISMASNQVEVVGIQTCFVPAPTDLTRKNGEQTIFGKWTDGQPIVANTIRVRVYQQTAGSNIFTEITPNALNYVAPDGSITFLTGIAQNTFNGTTIYLRVEKNNCLSGLSNGSLGNSGAFSPTPSVETIPILASTGNRSVAVRSNPNTPASVLIIYVNGVERSRTSTAINVNTVHTFTLTGLIEGDRVTARAQASGTNTFLSNISNEVIVAGSLIPSNPPSINDTYVQGSNISVSGISSEIAGTTIYLYKAGNVLLGSTTVSAFGTWQIDGLTLAAGDVITAKAQAPGKTLSNASTAVTVAAGIPSTPFVIGGIMAGQTFVSGSGGNGTITIYVDGTPIGTTTGGSWSLSGINPLDIFKGAEIYATNTVSGVESIPSNKIKVTGVESFRITNPANLPIDNQVAGIPFDIKISAMDQLDGAGNLVTTFANNVTIASSSTILQGGGTSPNFSSGVLSPHAMSLATAGPNHHITAISKTDPTAFGKVILNLVSPNSIAKFEIEMDRTLDAGVLKSMTIKRLDFYNNPVTEDDQLVYLFAEAGAYKAVANGPNINQIVIPAGQSSVQVWYTHTSSGVFDLTVSEANPANGTIGIDDATHQISVSGSSLSNNAFLENILISSGVLNPSFNAEKKDYQVEVPNKTDAIIITPIKDDEKATVTINGKLANADGKFEDFDLFFGENIFTIAITAEDGTVNTYTLKVVRIEDGTSPTVIISSEEPNPSKNNSFIIKLTFNEEITGLTKDKLTVVNGTASEMVEVDATTFTFMITPTDEGEVKVILEADKVNDLAGNGNEVSNEFNIVYKSSPYPVNLSGSFTISSKHYDGNTTAGILENNIILNGIQGNENVTLKNIVFEFEQSGVGEEIIVRIISAELDGADKDKYVLSLTDAPSAKATIAPKFLTIINAVGQSKTYEGISHAGISGAEISGIVGNDEVNLINANSGTFVQAAAGTGIVISTNFSLEGKDAGNYILEQPALTADINRAALTVTVLDNTKIYGAADPDFEVKYEGFVNGEDFNKLTGNLIFNREEGESVGTYKITPSGLTSGNYTITFVKGALAITAKTLTATAENKSKVYGAADPQLTVTYDGFERGEDASDLGGSLTFNRAAGESVGSYTITPSGLTSSNYTITFVNGNLDITPKTLTITAENKSKVFGSADSVFTVTYNGFEAGDDASDLGGSLTFNRAAGETVGSYAITPSGLTSANYSITFVNGNLDITPKTLTITAENKSKVFGSVDPVFTVTYIGFDAGDDASDIGGSLTFNRAAGESVGSYTITPSGLTSSNYTITFVNGNLDITPKTLTITAENKSKVFGSVDPEFTVTYDGFEAGEDVSYLAGSLSFTRVAGESVGTYAITPSGLTSSNYAITFVNGNLNITPKTLTITAENKNKVFGSADPEFTVTYDGFEAGEDVSYLAGSLSFTRVAGETVGFYAITPSGLTSANYSITFVNGNLDITPKALTVTAENKSKVFGSADPVFTVTYDGFEAGEDASNLGGALTFNRAAGELVGSYTITPSGLTSSNYTITFVNGILDISAKALTVTVENKSKVFGSADPVFTVTYIGFEAGEDASDLGGSLTFNRIVGEAVGSYAITPSGLTSSNYTITFVNGNLDITPKTLTITAENKSKVFGSADPVFTVTYDGFEAGEDASDLGGSLTFNRIAGEAVGSYAITPSGLTSSNYTITFVTGNLTITPKTLTITAENKSKVFGSVDPVFTVTYIGFEAGDDASDLGGSLSFTRVAGETVGSYAITPSGLTSSNYTITFVNGNLDITPKTLTITAENKSKVFGSADPVFTVTYNGFEAGEDASDLGGSLSFTRVAGETVGSYAITPSGLTSSNYTITFVTGNLTITPKTLTITAENKSKVFGSVDPVFTVTYIGFEAGDDASDLGGSLSFTRVAGETVGSYAITPSGLTSSNYTITFVNGNLNITPKTLTITAENKNKVFGSADPEFTVTYDGFEAGEDVSYLAGSLSFTRVAGETVGFYAITPSGLTSANYSITFVNGNLDITPKALTITAENKSKVFGSADPVFTVTYDGFEAGEDASNLGGALTFNRAAGESVGTYAITPSGLTSSNYAINFNNGNLNITTKALTVTAENKSKVFGSADPGFTVTYDGFEAGDNASNLGGTLTFNRAAGESVGSYTITPSGLTSSNYTITYVNGNLEITAKALTVTAENKSKVFGSADPVFTVNYSGFENGDDFNSLGGSLAFTRAEGENVSTYAITPSGFTSGNYTLNFVEGIFSISSKVLTVNAENKSKVFGSIDPGFTVNYSGFEGNDSASDLGGTLTFERAPGENVGSYAITPSGLTSANYFITFVNGNLDITPKTLTITAENKSKVFGSADPAFTVTYDGFEAGEDASNLGGSLSFTRVAGETVGSYAITPSGLTSANYSITFVNGKLDIAKGSLTVSAIDSEKFYGKADPEYKIKISGFAAGDDISSLNGSLIFTRASGEKVGTYAIVPSGLISSNYELEFIPAILKINPVRLVVTVDQDQGKYTGQVDPNFTYKYTGLVFGEDGSVFTGTLSRALGEDVGQYAISLGSLSAGSNYQIEFSPAMFIISPTRISQVMDIQDMVVEWKTAESKLELPKEILVMTVDGRFIYVPVTWNLSQVNFMGRGTYRVQGTLNLSGGIINAEQKQPSFTLTVLPKPDPLDILLSNNVFKGQTNNHFLYVGDFAILDPTDEIHEIVLKTNSGDNHYFQLNGNSLYWNSAERLEGKNSFKIYVKVTDRDGNIIYREFDIARTRMDIDQIKIVNTFTPDGDGINDTWGIEELRFYKGVRLSVFERSGQRVFYTENPDKVWDGTYYNKEVASGAYYYTLEIGELNIVKKGFLNIFRK